MCFSCDPLIVNDIFLHFFIEKEIFDMLYTQLFHHNFLKHSNKINLENMVVGTLKVPVATCGD